MFLGSEAHTAREQVRQANILAIAQEQMARDSEQESESEEDAEDTSDHLALAGVAFNDYCKYEEDAKNGWPTSFCLVSGPSVI